MPSFYFTPDEMCTTLKLEMKRIHDFFMANGWKPAPGAFEADVVLCATCSGWSKLERNSLNTLASLQNIPGTLVSVGCTNEVNPGAVDGVHAGRKISTRHLQEIELLAGDIKVRFADVPAPSTFRSRDDYRLFDLTKRFVNICMGCSFSCTYCPHCVGLGKLRSRSEKDILGQVRRLVDEGVRVVVLTGMETAQYGRDIGTTFPRLLSRVLELDAGYAVHVAQFHPLGVAQYASELVALFSNGRVTDIQIPIQTTSHRLLKMMNRPPLSEHFFESLGRIRAANPKAILRTDLIVGFPTEEMEELDATLASVTACFDEVAVYGIELRKGLPAEKYMPLQYSRREIERRIAYAMRVVESRGCLSHGGQQADVSLVEIEARKQTMRKVKGQL